MEDHDQHESLIKTPKQLIIVVVLAFVVPIGLGLLLSQLVTSGVRGAHEDNSAVMARIQPVGHVVLAGARVPLTAEQVYGQVCKTCHETGLLNAPKFGDKASWAKVIAQGQAVTVGHALNGYKAMPAKGGNPDFDNVDVERAVVFMANKAGANWKEPAGKEPAAPANAPAAATASPSAAPIATAAAAAAPAMVASAAPAAAAVKPDGKKIFESTCTVCHGAGIAGAPKFGDKAAWAPRLATGIDTLYKVALAGKGAMPAKGGNTSLSDAEVKAAVDYMAAASK